MRRSARRSTIAHPDVLIRHGSGACTANKSTEVLYHETSCNKPNGAVDDTRATPTWWIGGLVVRALDVRLNKLELDSRPPHYLLTSHFLFSFLFYIVMACVMSCLIKLRLID